jgi:hypothetical protein
VAASSASAKAATSPRIMSIIARPAMRPASPIATSFVDVRCKTSPKRDSGALARSLSVSRIDSCAAGLIGL